MIIKRIVAVILIVITFLTATSMTVSAKTNNNNGNSSSNNGNNGKDKNYIISFKNSSGKEKAVKEKKNKVSKSHDNSNILTLELSEQEALDMRSDASVAYIEEDGKAEILAIDNPNKNDPKTKEKNKNSKKGVDTQQASWGIGYIGADIAINSQNGNKYDGKNVRIASC